MCLTYVPANMPNVYIEDMTNLDVQTVLVTN